MSKNLPKKRPENAKDHTVNSLPLRKQLFKLAFTEKLDNGYEIDDMTQSDIAKFHRFVSDTVYKQLSISDVDKLYLRKQGLSDAPAIVHNGIELLHYGKDREPFRIFGYYNNDGYFVICRIDGSHKTHRQ